MSNSQILSRRGLFKTSAFVGVSALVGTSAFAHGETPEMLTVAGKGRPSMIANGEMIIDLDRFAVYKIDLDTVDMDATMLSARGKKISLAEFLKASAEIGVKREEVFAGTIAVTGSPFNFPEISKGVANEIFERPVLAASSGTAYWCAVWAYGCHHY